MCNFDILNYKPNPELSAIIAENKANFVDGCAYVVSLETANNAIPFGITKKTLDDINLHPNPKFIDALFDTIGGYRAAHRLELGSTFFYTIKDAEAFLIEYIELQENQLLYLKQCVKNQANRLNNQLKKS